MNLYLNEVSSAPDALFAVIPTAQSGRITLCDMRDGVDQITGNTLKGLFVPKSMGGQGNENKEDFDVFDTEQFPRYKNTVKGLEAALKSAIDQLYLSQVKLEKGTKAYKDALKKLNLENEKYTKEEKGDAIKGRNKGIEIRCPDE